MKKFATILVCLLLAGSYLNADESGPQYYLIESQVLVVTGQKMTMISRSSQQHEDVLSAKNIDTIKIGDLSLDLDADWIWSTPDGPPPDSGIELLTAPRVVVQAGGQVQTRSAKSVQYLEPGDNGCLEVRSLPAEDSPGFFLDLVPRPGPADETGAETVDLKLKLRISTLGERAVIPGVNLDVGRPALHSKEIESVYHYRLGKWNLISSYLSPEPEKQVLVVLLRVSRQNSDPESRRRAIEEHMQDKKAAVSNQSP